MTPPYIRLRLALLFIIVLGFAFRCDAGSAAVGTDALMSDETKDSRNLGIVGRYSPCY